MVRPSVLLLLCGSLLLPMTAVARLPGPLQAVPAAKVRDLTEIRSSRVLRVLVNQSRNSSGEVQGQAIGVGLANPHFAPGCVPEGDIPKRVVAVVVCVDDCHEGIRRVPEGSKCREDDRGNAAGPSAVNQDRRCLMGWVNKQVEG